jgi:hypothetical protein
MFILSLPPCRSCFKKSVPIQAENERRDNGHRFAKLSEKHKGRAFRGGGGLKIVPSQRAAETSSSLFRYRKRYEQARTEPTTPARSPVKAAATVCRIRRT